VREQAFRHYLLDRGMTVDEDLIIDGNFREAETYTAITELLTSGKQVDALVAANDNMATAAVHAAQAFGLHVPNDLIVTGFDDRNIATECTPPLTTVRIDLQDHAKALAGTLLQRLAQKRSDQGFLLPQTTSAPVKQSLINGQLIIRGSSLAQRNRDNRATSSLDYTSAKCQNTGLHDTGATEAQILNPDVPLAGQKITG